MFDVGIVFQHTSMIQPVGVILGILISAPPGVRHREASRNTGLAQGDLLLPAARRRSFIHFSGVLYGV